MNKKRAAARRENMYAAVFVICMAIVAFFVAGFAMDLFRYIWPEQSPPPGVYNSRGGYFNFGLISGLAAIFVCFLIGWAILKLSGKLPSSTKMADNKRGRVKHGQSKI